MKCFHTCHGYRHRWPSSFFLFFFHSQWYTLAVGCKVSRQHNLSGSFSCSSLLISMKFDVALNKFNLVIVLPFQSENFVIKEKSQILHWLYQEKDLCWCALSHLRISFFQTLYNRYRWILHFDKNLTDIYGHAKCTCTHFLAKLVSNLICWWSGEPHTLFCCCYMISM